MLISIAAPVFAESAPVYDADTMQQQFESTDQPQADLPPPPPPGQESNTFVPVQQQPSASVNSVNPSNPSMPLEQRVRKVEQQVSNMQSNDSAARMESLQNQVQSLRAQVEQLTRQLQQVETQQKSMYSDLDKRVAQSKSSVETNNDALINTNDIASKPVKAKKTKTLLANNTETPSRVSASEETTPPPAVKGVENPPQQPDVAEEQQIYQTAYNLIKAKKYEDAVNALQKMLQKYPSGQFASNAHYWLGELYGLLGKNEQSLTEFNSVVKNYSSSPRISDAQLKIGLIYASESKWAEAKSALRKVINHYPGTASARLASEQLKQIKQAGH